MSERLYKKPLEANPVVIDWCHGTTSEKAPLIETIGLQPKTETREVGQWSGKPDLESRDDVIYISPDRHTCDFMASNATRVSGGSPIVYRINLTKNDEPNLEPDEDSLVDLCPHTTRNMVEDTFFVDDRYRQAVLKQCEQENRSPIPPEDWRADKRREALEKCQEEVADTFCEDSTLANIEACIHTADRGENPEIKKLCEDAPLWFKSSFSYTHGVAHKGSILPEKIT